MPYVCLLSVNAAILVVFTCFLVWSDVYVHLEKPNTSRFISPKNNLIHFLRKIL